MINSIIDSISIFLNAESGVKYKIHRERVGITLMFNTELMKKDILKLIEI